MGWELVPGRGKKLQLVRANAGLASPSPSALTRKQLSVLERLNQLPPCLLPPSREV